MFSMALTEVALTETGTPIPNNQPTNQSIPGKYHLLNNFMPFFYRLKHKIGFSIASFFEVDEQQELLKTANTHLLIWNHELMNLETGLRTVLTNMDADTIALAAKRITDKDVNNKLKVHIALYLSNIEFIATEYELPEMAAQNVASALSYQVNDLMPAYPGQLMLAVNHDESRDKNIVLWLDYNRIESLNSAFKEQAIELTAIVPRIILAALKKSENAKKNQLRQFTEHDENNLLQITLSHQSLSQWSSISNNDLKDKACFEQWQKQAEPVSDIMLIDSAGFWSAIERKHVEQLAYAFFPESARHDLKKHSRLKKGRLAVIAGIIIAILLALPFIKNVIRYNKYEKSYQEYKEKTVEIRKIRSAVTQFEDNWDLFIDYPRADIVAVIQKLNTIIPKHSWIKGFEIKDGYVEIDGYSPNPTNILEIISSQAEFSQVAFNQRTQSERGKNNEHFGIVFRLNSIDVEAYQEKYFPVN